mmetsp:Transcript_19971/g.18148  ORF Transcript_19971/g.18148 Transcript_19971/m.18148 type:complete len:376 (+) Transcript_19971:28-1155(+)
MNQIFRFFVLSLVISVSLANFAEKADELFVEFKAKYGRHYKDAQEEQKRLEIFRQSMIRVDKNNEINGSPVFGVTKFSDWTPEEFQVLLGRKDHGHPDPPKINNVRDPLHPELWSKTAKVLTDTVTSINWAESGVVTPVKNQGQCGSCWAFSAAEQIETQWAFEGNDIWEFSPQQIASCTTACDGCGGGDTVYAYEYIMSAVGLGSDWFAPYIQSMWVECLDATCTESCSSFDFTDLETYSSLTGPYATLSDYSYATPGCTGLCQSQNTSLLALNVATYGPASVCVNAASWSDYVSGVLSQSACGGYSYFALDHCVQLVGYNADATSPYWIVRNSWATNWGINGYILLQYPLNTCGLANEATFVSISNAITDFSS